MGKLTGSFESLIRGVSEQVPHDRFIGQHWTQDNMVSDPVRGLARRPGSVMLNERLMPGVLNTAAEKADLSTYKEFPFFIDNVAYSLMYRTQAKVIGSTLPGLVVINKDTGAILDVATEPTDSAAVLAALDGGISSLTNVAKYVLLGPNNRFPDFAQTDKVVEQQGHVAAWVRQGFYSRTYTVSLVRVGGLKYTGVYTTPSSYYPGTLDTSDILTSDPDYQKKVNDRVYAYQTAVNQWIGTASAAVQPAAIAFSLAVAINTAAGTPVCFALSGHVVATGAFTEIEADDGGDGSTIKSVGQEVEAATELTPINFPGKVVRIRPRQGTKDGIYYVKAVPKDGIVDSTWKEVSWQETAGILVQPGFVTLVSEIIGNTFYIATNFLTLGVVSGDSNQQDWADSSSGDFDSQELPQLFGKKIDYLGNFQDRLMIVSGSTVALSRSGDYVNFFRQSALTLPADDPIETFAIGSKGDVITDAVLMDRSLIMFGKRQHYAIDGRTAMTPTSAYIAIQQKFEDSNVCPPVPNGNFIFFAQPRNNRLTLQQMQTGDYADSFRCYEITSQLDGYISGTPRQILPLTSPSMLCVRTKELANGFYVFSYLDSADQSQRLYDSWSKWTFNTNLGSLVGLAENRGNILALTLRETGAGNYFVVDQFSRGADLSTNPYLDSMRPYTNLSGTITPTWTHVEDAAIAFNNSAGESFLLGEALVDYQDLFDAAPEVSTAYAMMGAYYESSFEPTAPYKRDSKEKAVLDCELTLGSYNITVVKSAAVRGYVRGATQPQSEETLVMDWIYRPAGGWILNVQQIAAIAQVTVDVQQEIREFRLRLASRNWLPLTFSSIEWAGQFFTQRNN